MHIFRREGFLLLGVLLGNGFAQTQARVEPEKVLRAEDIQCGLYLANPNGIHGRRVASLEPKEMRSAIVEHGKKPEKLAVVGVHPEDVVETTRSLRNTLADLDMPDVPVQVMRRLESFVASELGLFVRGENDSWERVAPLNEDAIRQAAEAGTLDPQREYLLVGAPLFAGRNGKIRAMMAEQGLVNIQQRSAWTARIEKVLRHPLQAMRHYTHKTRFFFPLAEDFIPPAPSEINAGTQKVLIPGLITMSVMLATGQPLEVLIPVTLVNSANTFSTGAYRATIGNWWRRSPSFFPSMWLKNVTMSVYFSATLYWAGRGNLDAFSEVLTAAGWQTFITTRWLSVVFQTLWRLPVASAGQFWEQKKLEELGSQHAEQVRRSASSMEKYTSYIMTQFFLYSLIAKESLGRVIFDAEQGLNFTQALVPPETLVLMDVNYGHAAMASLGALSFVFMRNMGVLNRLGAAALALDQREEALNHKVLAPLKNIVRSLRGQTNQDGGAEK